MLSFQSSKIKTIESIEAALKFSLNEIDWSFDYPNPSGLEELRSSIKTLHPHWSGEVLMTNSATEATYLALSQLEEGMTLALNVPSYFGVIRQAKDLGLNIVEWTNIKELKKITSIDCILLTSNFTPPTGCSFSDKDKAEIALIANNQDALVIEDNAYEFLSYENKALTSINAKKVIRINSFSKLLTPNLRMGFLMAKKELLSKIRSKKITMNLSSSGISQQIINEVLKDQSLIRQWSNELSQRYDVAFREIEASFDIKLKKANGGSFISLPLKQGIDLEKTIIECKKNGLLIDNNNAQYLSGYSLPYIRLHLGAIKANEIKKAIKIIKNSLILENNLS